MTIGAAPPWLIIGLTFWRCRSHLAILPASRATGSSGLTFVDRLIVHDPRNHRARILIVVATTLQHRLYQETFSGDLRPQACYCLHRYPEIGKLIAEVAVDNSRFGR